VFPYFTNNYDFFTFKKKDKINNLFIILVIIIIFKKLVGQNCQMITDCSQINENCIVKTSLIFLQKVLIP
jgi:hypothetical protein